MAKGLKFLLDQGIPADAARLLRELAFECEHVAELGMHAAEDQEILALAADRDDIIVTLDADFHALIAVRRMSRPSVVRIRREGCRAEEVVRILREVIDRHRALLGTGCLVSVKEMKTTVHRLPIGDDLS